MAWTVVNANVKRQCCRNREKDRHLETKSVLGFGFGSGGSHVVFVLLGLVKLACFASLVCSTVVWLRVGFVWLVLIWLGLLGSAPLSVVDPPHHHHPHPPSCRVWFAWLISGPGWLVLVWRGLVWLGGFCLVWPGFH
jgi:hypothetical protein